MARRRVQERAVVEGDPLHQRRPHTPGMVNLRTLANRASDALGLPQGVSRAVAERFLEEIARALVDRDEVYLHRFGRFYFTLQDNFNDDYYKERGLLKPEKRHRLRCCRFVFQKRLRVLLNEIEETGALSPDQAARLDYKRPVAGNIPEGEAERRARAGITLGEIVKRIDKGESWRRA